MTSERKIAANRRNSMKSTGPRTAWGKTRVRRNALRHGLAAEILRHPTISAAENDLTNAICGKDADPIARHRAQKFAACEIVLRRVRATRAKIFEQLSRVSAGDLNSLRTRSELVVKSSASLFEQLRRLERYERRAFSMQARSMRISFKK